MSQISITVNGRDYSIVCDDGQEEHLTRLSEYIDSRVSEIVESVGQIGESRLLLMVALLIADELSDSYAELAALKGESSDVAAGAEAQAAMKEEMAAMLEAASQRIEAIAERLEQA